MGVKAADQISIVDVTDGDDGTSVTVISIGYQAGSSSTVPPSGSWSPNPVTVPEGQYLWTKTTFSDNSVAYTVAKQGAKGDTGDTGPQGRSITLTVRYYQLASSEPSRPSDGSSIPSGWGTVEPNYTPGDTRNLYFVDQYNWNSGTTPTYSTVSLSSSYEAARDAYNKAEAAELAKIDRVSTNASMDWDGNVLKIEAIDPITTISYAVEIGGDGIEFKYDGASVASIDQDQLVISKTVVLKEMQVNMYWTWMNHGSDNNLCLKWLGGNS